jgi:hypothetical protein
VFVVTINPYAPAGRYYGPQLVCDGDWHEVSGDSLVIFAAHGPDDGGRGRRSVLVVPAGDVLAVDEV